MKLNSEDKRRLIYLAFVLGDRDTKNVAEYLMQKLDPTPSDVEELLTQLSPRDRAEIERLRTDSGQVHVSGEDRMRRTENDRITAQLRKAIDEIGSLDVEQAYWVLLPKDLRKAAMWIEAIRVGDDEVLSQYRFHSEAIYVPDREERYSLLNSMRGASSILHVHNHPKLPGYSGFCHPSDEDRAFAAYWKTIRPELAGKMKFFVVQESSAVEYSEERGFEKRWL